MDMGSFKSIKLDVVKATESEVQEFDILSMLSAIKKAVEKEIVVSNRMRTL